MRWRSRVWVKGILVATSISLALGGPVAPVRAFDDDMDDDGGSGGVFDGGGAMGGGLIDFIGSLIPSGGNGHPVYEPPPMYQAPSYYYPQPEGQPQTYYPMQPPVYQSPAYAQPPTYMQPPTYQSPAYQPPAPASPRPNALPQPTARPSPTPRRNAMPRTKAVPRSNQAHLHDVSHGPANVVPNRVPTGSADQPRAVTPPPSSSQPPERLPHIADPSSGPKTSEPRPNPLPARNPEVLAVAPSPRSTAPGSNPAPGPGSSPSSSPAPPNQSPGRLDPTPPHVRQAVIEDLGGVIHTEGNNVAGRTRDAGLTPAQVATTIGNIATQYGATPEQVKRLTGAAGRGDARAVDDILKGMDADPTARRAAEAAIRAANAVTQFTDLTQHGGDPRTIREAGERARQAIDNLPTALGSEPPGIKELRRAIERTTAIATLQQWIESQGTPGGSGASPPPEGPGKPTIIVDYWPPTGVPPSGSGTDPRGGRPGAGPGTSRPVTPPTGGSNTSVPPTTPPAPPTSVRPGAGPGAAPQVPPAPVRPGAGPGTSGPAAPPTGGSNTSVPPTTPPAPSTPTTPGRPGAGPGAAPQAPTRPSAPSTPSTPMTPGQPGAGPGAAPQAPPTPATPPVPPSANPRGPRPPAMPTQPSIINSPVSITNLITTIINGLFPPPTSRPMPRRPMPRRPMSRLAPGVIMIGSPPRMPMLPPMRMAPTAMAYPGMGMRPGMMPAMAPGMMPAMAPAAMPGQAAGYAPPQIYAATPAQLGVPAMSGPPVASVPPSTPMQGKGSLLIAARDLGASINYTLNGSPFDMQPGFRQKLDGSRAWTIRFDRGGSFGPAEYTLTGGTYEWTITDRGWDLRRRAFRVTVDNTANDNEFHFVVGDQQDVVPAGQSRTIVDDFPIVLAFDRGDGREPAKKELLDGSYRVGVDATSNRMDLFPGSTPLLADASDPAAGAAPAPEPAPGVFSEDAPSAPAPPPAPEPAPALTASGAGE